MAGGLKDGMRRQEGRASARSTADGVGGRHQPHHHHAIITQSPHHSGSYKEGPVSERVGCSNEGEKVQTTPDPQRAHERAMALHDTGGLAGPFRVGGMALVPHKGLSPGTNSSLDAMKETPMLYPEA